MVGDKVNEVGTASIPQFSNPSTNASAIVSKIDCLYGGDSGINYYFEFKLNANLPKYGLISVEFHTIFDSFYKLGCGCTLINLPAAQLVK